MEQSLTLPIPFITIFTGNNEWRDSTLMLTDHEWEIIAVLIAKRGFDT